MEKSELIKLWANDTKRREYINNYQSWGVWFKVPQLDATFYKCDLPDNSRIIAMEYLAKTYFPMDGEPGYHTAKEFYLQKFAHFTPEHVSDSFIAGHLMDLKKQYQNEAIKNPPCSNTAGRK